MNLAISQQTKEIARIKIHLEKVDATRRRMLDEALAVMNKKVVLTNNDSLVGIFASLDEAMVHAREKAFCPSSLKVEEVPYYA